MCYTLDHPPLTFDDLLHVSSVAFGGAGRRTALLWRQYAAAYFADELVPVPILYVPAAPYGHWVGLCGATDHGTGHIYILARPWLYTRGILLHEMTHTYLKQRGENAKHAGEPWCREVRRISKLMGRELWAGRTTTKRDGKRVFRANVTGPNGEASIPQEFIARWPYGAGMIPPDLDETAPTTTASNQASEHTNMQGGER